MRVYKNDWFAKFARKERIGDATLLEAIGRAEAGLIDADLGSGLLKQRLARQGAGKSGGFRTLIFFRAGERAIFVYGFAKNDKANLTEAQLMAFRKASKIWLALSQKQIDVELEAQSVIEVHDANEDI